MRSPGLLAGLLTLAACATDGGQRPGRAAELLAADPAAFHAIAYRDLGRGGEILVNADTVLHAASTMKLAVMIEVFRQAERAALELDDELPVHDDFASLVGGERYRLDPQDDSDPELYAALGRSVPIRELVRAMIVRSSNLATNLLIEKVGAAAVQRTVEELGADGMRVLRGVEDGPAHRAGLDNTTTARALLVLLEAVERGTAASPESCREMIRILRAQEHDDLIPAGLPPGTVVAHKTGRIRGIQHDAALVYPDDAPPYVLVVLTRGFADEQASAEFIAAIAAELHRTHVGS